MKIITRLFLILLFFMGAAVLVTTLTGTNYVYRAIWYNVPDIDDYSIFNNRVIPAANPHPWPISARYNRMKPGPALEKELDHIGTVALLVVHADSLYYESYHDGYADSSISGSFSVAKSIIGTLTGIALREGKIKSLDEPVGDFIPEFRTGEKAKLQIRHLLSMSSGTSWDESYSSPFSNTTEAYYGTDLKTLMRKLRIAKEPGSEWRYKSGDTQLMAWVLEKATGESISAYAAEKLWKPLGAVSPALWSLDRKDGMEKAYCCFNATARDFARLGGLFLHHGKWMGQTLLDSTYVARSTQPCMIPDETGKPCNYYGYFWWLLPEHPGVFYARGILGQYIICIPATHTIMVRLGKHRGDNAHESFQEVYDLVDWADANFHS